MTYLMPSSPRRTSLIGECILNDEDVALLFGRLERRWRIAMDKQKNCTAARLFIDVLSSHGL